MNIIKSRSPYFVSLDEVAQIGGKLEIFLWHKGQTEPTTPTYTLSKLIPSISQRRLDWNISNYINEFIDIVNPVKVVNVTAENANNWCFCRVKKYKLIGSTYTLVTDVNFIGVQGFTEYTDGYNDAIVNDNYLLCNNSILNNYRLFGDYGYFNLLIDSNVNDYQIIYNNSGGTFTYNIPSDVIDLYKIPYSNASLGDPELPCTITIYDDTNNVVKHILKSAAVEECKYTPVECTFINSNGGWQFLTFFKAQSNSISVKGSDYNLLPDAVDYNVYRGQNKVFNINGNKTIKCNTGWVTENYNELIQDLLLSETILLDNKPAKVKTQSFTYKTDLLDRNINFEIEFEYAFDLINNIV